MQSQNNGIGKSEKRIGAKSTYFIKSVCFIIIGVLIFGMIQVVFLPKRAPYTKSYDAGKLTGFYREEKNSIDVLISSTSHLSKGVLPMELYEKYGIKSYNLSTSIQPIEATYYLLCEALKTQSPKVFIIDVSNLYFSSVEAKYWWFVLDEMHLGENKLALMHEYKENADGGDESSREMLFPLVRYHTRWKELTEIDFTAIGDNKHYFGKGGQMNTSVAAAEITVEEMNAIADQLLQSTEKNEYVYDGENTYQNHEENILYDTDIPEKNIEWLEKIKKLCDENDIQLLAIKTPTIYMPQGQRSVWLEEKYHKIQKLCKEHHITYYDLLYDADLGIDWSRDSSDQGIHLNLLGAQKVSAGLGEYLKENYQLPDGSDEQWDRDLASYQKVRKIGELQVQKDFIEYINMLANEYKEMTILMAAEEDMAVGLTEDDICALRLLGLQADFSNAANQSYVAVIENGEVKYESLSNRQINYKGTCDKSSTIYELYSSGWWAGSGVSIKVGDEEYAYNHKGLNIVIYDNERALVVDSVCFETNQENHIANRDNAKINEFEEAFERRIIKEYK